ncbi:MAG: hypothetical protein AAF604_13315 [Acidobacteriota bacterium]
MATQRPEPAFYQAPADLGGLQRLALVIGGLAAAGCLLGFFSDSPQFYRSYLVGWFFVLSIPLGCLGFCMIQHLTQGTWGLLARRIYEAAAQSIVALFFLGLPIVFGGFSSLYIWATPEKAPPELVHLLHHKEPWLNPSAVTLRYFIVFAVWLGLAFLLTRLSNRQDSTGNVRLSRKMRVVAAPGLVLFVFSITVAAFDWLMSIEPAWFSTLYGVWFIAAMGLGALCFTVILMNRLQRAEPLSRYVDRSHFHDWGKLMLAFVMLWAYFTFSQFLIIWSGNQLEETEWYFHRLRNGWGPFAVSLFVLHFFVPFALLLSRDVKRNTRLLAVVAAFLLVMCWFDIFMQTVPSYLKKGPVVHWLDLAAPLAVGGLWLATFVHFVRRRPLLPYNDPYLKEPADG